MRNISNSKKAGIFWRDEKGAVAIISAIVMPVFVGGLGLGAETGYWYYSHRKLQHAADVAAHAGATRVRSGERSLIQAAASTVGQASGFRSSYGTLVANSPPTSGPNAGKPLYVEVIITETRPRLLSGLFSTAPVVFSARAVAGLSAQAANGCVLALSKTAPRAIEIGGSAQVQVNDCDVASNSNAANAFEMVGNAASLSTGCVQTVGQGVGSPSLTLTRCSSIYDNAPPVRDPYEGVADPAVEGPCVNNPNVRDETITPSYNHSSGVKSIRFCKGFRIQGTVQLKPGLYIIDTDELSSIGNSLLKLAPKASGEPDPGVTFYFTNGAAVKIAANAEYDLGPSTSGPYKGILFFGSRTSAGVGQQVNGTVTSKFQGAIYMPKSNIQFSGNNNMTSGCMQLIGDTVTLTGNSKFFHSCDSSVTQPVRTSEKVVLSE